MILNISASHDIIFNISASHDIILNISASHDFVTTQEMRWIVLLLCVRLRLRLRRVSGSKGKACEEERETIRGLLGTKEFRG